MKHQLASLPHTSGFFDKVHQYFQKNTLQRKIRDIENNFQLKVDAGIRRHTDHYRRIKNRLDYIDTNIQRAIDEDAFVRLRDLDRKKSVVDELLPTVFGAIGEHKVSTELELLPDNYILINDFTCTFNPPIYNRKEKDNIRSVQIDHILVAPSGIFLIETKNWSEESIQKLNLRSPVEQIRRTNFALYKTLSGKANALLRHHWGTRKFAIYNLIVLINQKPVGEFQHVKILTLKQLRNYIGYFKPVFSDDEVELIAEYLLFLCGKTV